MSAIFFILIAFSIYLSIEKIIEKKVLQKINKYVIVKNEYYYKEFLKKYDKSKKVKLTEKLNLKYKINMLLDKAGVQQNIFVNMFTVILCAFICFVGMYLFVFSVFKIVGISIIVAMPATFIPFVVLNIISVYKTEKLEKVFLNFLLQLKNYTKIGNDVVSSMKSVHTLEPLQSYINKFTLEINNGIKFETAIEHLKDKIRIKKIKEFFTNVQYCYLYGGDFSCLIDKSYKIISEIQKEKNKRKQETQGARVVLIILILLNVFVYVNFIPLLISKVNLFM